MKKTTAMQISHANKKIKFAFLTLTLFMLSLTSTASRHINLNCWNLNGTYNILVTGGSNNGKIEVTTYTNSSKTVIVPGGNMQTYILNSSGSVSFTVPQPLQNTPVYVYIKWYKLSDGEYEEEDCSGKYTSTCLALAIKTLEILDAKNVKNTTVITFRGESTTDNEQIILNFTMPDGTTRRITLLFWTKLEPQDIWEATIDNVLKTVNIKKL